jgi:hypothetical protein
MKAALAALLKKNQRTNDKILHLQKVQQNLLERQ